MSAKRKRPGSLAPEVGDAWSVGNDEVPTALVEAPEEELEALEGDFFSPAFLYVEQGPGKGQLLELKQGPVEIGRASTADLRIQHSSISRRHLEVRRVGERFFLKDLGSQNGTLVNQAPITTEVELKPMATIEVGSAVIRLQGNGNKTEAPRRETTNLQLADTAVVARPLPPPRRRSVVPIAVMAGSIGFGLAVLLAIGLSAMRASEPGPSPVAAIREAPKAPEVTPKPQEAQELQEPTLDPLPSPPPGPPPRVTRPLPRAIRLAAGARPAVPAQDEKRGGKTGRAAILAAYERGDAETSLKAARQAGDQDLVAKLSAFLEASLAGRRAAEAHELGAAIASYQKALSWDGQISSGWGKYGGDLRRQLAAHQVLAGKQREAQGDVEGARKAYEAALASDPTNEVATTALAQAGRKVAKSPDEAFNGPPEATKTAAKKSIDDAFGE